MSGADASTIFALSSGSPPAAIAIVRISGPAARDALVAMVGRVPKPRAATVAWLRDPASGERLDRALVLSFPGPGSATGEDLAELHLHGGRAVVAAVSAALEGIPGLRPAEAGEFTRRAFLNGRIDLAEAEGLADLLLAETEGQRRAAMTLAGGSMSRKVAEWQHALLGLAAQVEALLDFSDEGDVDVSVSPDWVAALDRLMLDIEKWLCLPASERLRDGVKVVIAGPPNAGKSTLLNALVGREAAITSAVPGTTRDIIEAPTAIGGIPFLLVDTAGLRDSDDPVEEIGVERGRAVAEAADILLWLGDAADAPAGEATIVVRAKADVADSAPGISVSALTGEGLQDLIGVVQQKASRLVPHVAEGAINRRHRSLLRVVRDHLREAEKEGDPLLRAENLRLARVALDEVTGRAGVERMLDHLFGSFCIGK
jgi:tRNA modification GTPase